jgi:hypothetical protein
VAVRDVEHQQVDVELVVVDLEAPLAADEREPGPELEQEPLDLRDQGWFEIALSGRGGEGEEVEVVGVLGQPLHQLGVAGRRGVSEARRGGAGPSMQLGHDLTLRYCPGPAVLDRRPGVPLTCRLVVEPVEEQLVVPHGMFHTSYREDGGHAAARRRISSRLPGERPFISGNSWRRSVDRGDHLGASSFGRLAFRHQLSELPYRPTSSLLAASTALVRAA